MTSSLKFQRAANKFSPSYTKSAAQAHNRVGGNHGLGVAFAGRLVGVPVTICLPANVPPQLPSRAANWEGLLPL